MPKQDKAKEAHRAAKEAFHGSKFGLPDKDIQTLNKGIEQIASKVVPMQPKAKTGREVFDDVRNYLDKAVAGLERGEYKEFLDLMGGTIQSYQDCFDEEEKEGA